jgi:hypothetical protein
MADFDWKIWGKKWATGLGTTILATAIVFTANYIQATTFPAEYAFWGGLVIIVLNQIANFIKHN